MHLPAARAHAPVRADWHMRQWHLWRRIRSCTCATRRHSQSRAGLAEMLKGGVIMDVVTPEQAKVAEDAGAAAVMALERVPADIRRDGGVARMSDPEMIAGIQEAVTIPVMAKARIGHFVEAQVLRGAGGGLHRRVGGADARRRGQPHRQVGLQGAVRVRRHQPRRGAAADRRGRGDDPLQGRGRHRRHRRGGAPHARASRGEIRRLAHAAGERAGERRQGARRRRSISCAGSPPRGVCRSCCSAPAASPRPPTRR